MEIVSKLSERIQVYYSEELEDICEKGRELYNLCNFLYRQRYFFRLEPDRFNFKWLHRKRAEIFKKYHKKFTSFQECNKELKELNNNYIQKINNPSNKQGYHNSLKLLSMTELRNLVKFDEKYTNLPTAGTAQNIIKNVMKDWSSYFQALKIWRKNPLKFRKRPQIPKYRKKTSVVSFTYMQCRIKDGYLYFPKKGRKKNTPYWIHPIKIRLPDSITYKERNNWEGNLTKLDEVRIVQKRNYYVIEIVYEKKTQDLGLNKENLLSIDIGVNNIISAVPIINFEIQKPFIIKGGVVKSINQYFNKQTSKLRSIAKTCNKKDFTKRIHNITRIRNNKLSTIFHRISKRIIEYCIENNIGMIVVGKNKLWKQKVKLSKKISQNFVQIPFNTLIEKMKYKGDMVGIELKTVDEAYTSKCSFLDNEEICKHKTYKGKRISRGLFRTLDGKIINADINASLNIAKKGFPNILTKVSLDGIEGSRLMPLVFAVPESGKWQNHHKLQMVI